MDYIGNKCPVCGRYFHADDDVVVCPECGTPHHRECYEQLGHCYNEKLHAENYVFEEERESSDSKICPSCGKENDKTSFFCKYCGASLNGDKTDTENPVGGEANQQANGFPYNMSFLDPLAGVPTDTDLGDGVTAGEAAKYVKQNTPYFIRVFSSIKNLNKSRFNFPAAMFIGGYMLYRKMYKLGAVFAAIQLAIMTVEVYISIAFQQLFADLMQVYTEAADTSQFFANYSAFIAQHTTSEVLILFLPTLLDVARIILMVVTGFCFNRMYMTHCKKEIIKIKNSVTDGENADTLLQTKGGVNTALAVSLMFAAAIIYYLPRLIPGLM